MKTEKLKPLFLADLAVVLTPAEHVRWVSQLGNTTTLTDQSLPFYRGLGLCRVWEGLRNEHGYGTFFLRGKLELAHRVSLRMQGVDIFNGGHVLHKCDNPACVEPDHLYVGDAKANYKDAKDRDRVRRPPYERLGTRGCPERAAWGDRNGSRTHPERLARGVNHHAYGKPSPHRGEASPRSKLKNEQAEFILRAIRDRSHTRKDLAGMFGVSISLVKQIVRREVWTHINI